MSIYSVLLAVLIINYNDVFTLDSCSLNLKCQDCIRDPSLCIWCPTNTYNGTRCRALNSSQSDWCPEKDRLENPTNSKFPVENLEFSYDPKHVVQIKPQKYKIKLRPGMSEEFSFAFQSAQDFPVDLYFLLDASATMSNIKKLTAEQSEKIYMTMKDMTKNVHLGYGTFVDKRTFPFTDTFNTEETYSFRHRLALTKNFTTFKETVAATPVGTNIDVPEGGLDALAQVMACHKIIDWRDESRKIIVFLTNGPYHAAGDGRAAGIFQPYDGNCYTEKDTYANELKMDYPSVGILNKLAIETNIIVLFFVEESVEYIYKKLSNVISGSKYVTFVNDTDKESSDNSIADTLKDIYEKISKKIVLNKHISSKFRKNVHITLEPNCISEDTGSECDVEIGREKKFVGTIKVLKYSGYDNMTIDLAVEGIGEKLTLDIEVIKDCNCQSFGVEENSTHCHGEQRICGECSCGDKRYGDKCICEKTGDTVFSGNSSCIMEENKLCSGRGNCECGLCRCRAGYSGKFCQCNDLSCPLDKGKLCSGEKQGKCQCGKCICEPGWEGDACQCSKKDCIFEGKECNGMGHCSCGVCKCNPLARWDKRSLDVENCALFVGPSSQTLQCTVLENCAKCQRKEKNYDCMSCYDGIETKVVEILTKEYLNGNIWNVCPDIKVAVGCYSKFAYRYDKNKYGLVMVVERKENCAETHYLFGGICLLVLIVVGVLTLVAWKLLTDARDRREYKQFLEKSKHDATATDNPLYAPATSTFSNPGYRKRSLSGRL